MKQLLQQALIQALMTTMQFISDLPQKAYDEYPQLTHMILILTTVSSAIMVEEEESLVDVCEVWAGKMLNKHPQYRMPSGNSISRAYDEWLKTAGGKVDGFSDN